ncbi:nucleotidyltransferase family protein [Marinospirillum insulare]|uniref:Nucleotidyltransferase n=1 Tax=Marinospirillum insulare TaxID=217169 RepID=A0ABQ5ZVD8_9GAMM|nr:nucleotidyltransferase family protein [Marinospirillum insulare]GLR63012.1 nucleotidyltransferase [Marinospirillum insulare]
MTNKAMIFAAGEGKRMQPLTLHTPKPLLKVAGKPLIFWHLENLAAQGIKQVVINVSYLGQQIIDAVQEGSAWGLEVSYSVENTPLETGGGLLKAKELLGEEPFLLINGDLWISELPHLPPATQDELLFMLLVDNPEHNPQGDFFFAEDSGSLANQPRAGMQSKTFAGVSRINPALLDESWLYAAYQHQHQVGDAFILSPLLRLMIDEQKANAAVLTSHWVDVGTPERLTELNARLAKKIIEQTEKTRLARE